MAKHYTLDIGAGHFTFTHDQAAIAAEAALDGIYVLRTSVAAAALPTRRRRAAPTRTSPIVERDFRSSRPSTSTCGPSTTTPPTGSAPTSALTPGRLPDLAPTPRPGPAHLHRRTPPTGPDPVAPGARSAAADRKASRQTHHDGAPVYSFRGLLDHLATLTRNTVRFPATGTEVPMLTEATNDQRRAFDLIGAPIPLTAA